MLRTSHPSGLRPEASSAFKPLVPRYPTQSSVPNRVQNVVTESMVQPELSTPGKAHGLGETSTTMVNRDVQSEEMVVPHPGLVRPGCPNLTRKHPFGIIGYLMLEHYPAGPGQFPGHRPNRDNAIRLGLFSFVEALRQGLITDRKMRRL